MHSLSYTLLLWQVHHLHRDNRYSSEWTHWPWSLTFLLNTSYSGRSVVTSTYYFDCVSKAYYVHCQIVCDTYYLDHYYSCLQYNIVLCYNCFRFSTWTVSSTVIATSCFITLTTKGKRQFQIIVHMVRAPPVTTQTSITTFAAHHLSYL